MEKRSGTLRNALPAFRTGYACAYGNEITTEKEINNVLFDLAMSRGRKSKNRASQPNEAGGSVSPSSSGQEKARSCSANEPGK